MDVNLVEMDEIMLHVKPNVFIVENMAIMLVTVIKSNANPRNPSTTSLTIHLVWLRTIHATIVMHVITNKKHLTMFKMVIRLHLIQKTESWVHQRIQIK